LQIDCQVRRIGTAGRIDALSCCPATTSDVGRIQVPRSCRVPSNQSVALTQQQRWGSYIALAAVVAIDLATLRPGPPSYFTYRVVPCSVWENDKLLTDFVLNVLLFLPLGFGLQLAGARRWRIVAGGAALSTTIELLQLWVIPGRDASVLDVVANTLGTAGGLLTAGALTTILMPTPRTASRLFTTGVVACALALIATGLAFAPDPGGMALWTELTPQIGGDPSYAGELLSARVNGRVVRSERIPNDASLREDMHRGRIDADAIVRPAPVAARGAAIVRIADACGREIAAVAQRHAALSLRYRMRASAWGLATPGFVLSDAFASRGGAPTTENDTVRASVDRARVHLEVRGPQRVRSIEIDMNFGMGWTLFVPWNLALDARTAVISYLWIALICLPLGFWSVGASRHNRNGGRVVVAGALVIAAVITTGPLIFDFRPTPLGVWIGAIAGFLSGIPLGRWSQR